MLVVGVCGFHVLVLRRVGARDVRLARIGATVAAALLPLGAFRLWAETYAIFGIDEGVTWGGVRIVLESPWGTVWWVQMVAAAAAALALLWVLQRRSEGAWTIALFFAVIATASLAFTGHSMEEADRTLRVALQVGHVLGAGLWIGMLAVPLAYTRGVERPDLPLPAVLVDAFSPAALTGVLVLVASGLGTAVVYLDAWAQLWQEWYGRTLALKVLLFAGAGAYGFWNWRRVRPQLRQDPAALEILRRSATAELVLAVLVLAVTAVLVGLPLGHAHH